MKFLYLFAVGLLNIGIGFGVACWLKQRLSAAGGLDQDTSQPAADDAPPATEPQAEESSELPQSEREPAEDHSQDAAATNDSPDPGNQPAEDLAPAEPVVAEPGPAAEDTVAPGQPLAATEVPSPHRGEGGRRPDEDEPVAAEPDPATEDTVAAGQPLTATKVPSPHRGEDGRKPDEPVAAEPDPATEDTVAPEQPLAATEVPSPHRGEGGRRPDEGGSSTESLAAEEQDQTAEKGEQVERAAEQDEAPAEEAAAEPSVPSESQELLDKLLSELERRSATFAERYEPLTADPKPTDELELIAGEIGKEIQQLLQLVNATVDSLCDAEADEYGSTIERLENCWSDINEKAVRLVTLTFSEDENASTQRILAEASEGLSTVCHQVCEGIQQLHPAESPGA